MSAEQRKGTSPWVWVAVGCGGGCCLLLLVSGLLIAGAAYWGMRTVRQMMPPLAPATTGANAPLREVWQFTVSNAPLPPQGIPFSPLSVTSDDMDGDGQPEVLVTEQDGTLHVLNLQGQEKKKLTLGANIRAVRVVDINSDGKRGLLGWGHQSVALHDLNGQQIWSYSPSGQPISSAQAVDLDGDRKLEILVGSMGSAAGVGVLDAQGRLRTQFGLMGRNRQGVSSIAAGKIYRDGKPYVITAEMFGSIEVFDRQGSLKTTIAQGQAGYSSVHTADLNGDGVDEILATSPPMPGVGGTKGLLVALDGQGNRKWTYSLPLSFMTDIQPVRKVAVGDFKATGQRLIAALASDGSIHVVSLQGKPVVRYATGTYLGEIAVARRGKGKKDLILVTGGNQCLCLEVK